MTERKKINPQIKILLIDDFDFAIKERDSDDRRLIHPHLCFYKIISVKAVTYYRRYLDGKTAHLPDDQIEKWLLRHMGDSGNKMLDQVDTA